MADAGFRHDIAFRLDSHHNVQSIEVRPLVPAGYSGCSAASSARSLAGVTLSSKFIALVPEDAFSIPALVNGKGAPYAGQQEITDNDVMTAAGSLDADGKAALQAQMAAQGLKTVEEPKSFFMQYWHIIVPLGVFLLMQQFGGGGGGGGEAAPAAAGNARTA